MRARISLFLCGGLLFGLLAPAAFAQAPDAVVPESFKCADAAKDALPRLIKDLKSNDEKVRLRAVTTLGEMGAAAKPAVPALIEVAVNSRGHAETLKALAKIDDESTRLALRQLLVGGTGKCRCGRTFNSVVASAGEPIVPHLVALLNEKEFALNAELTLVQIGAPAVPHLVSTFEGRCKVIVDPKVIRVLTLLGPKAKAAAPALAARMDIATGVLRVRIAQALYTVNGSHQAALNVIHDALKSSDQTQKAEALQALVELQPKSKVLVPSVMSIFAGDDERLYSSAMSIMLSIGEPAVPALIEGLSKYDAKHGVYVLYTLHNMGPSASAAVPTLIKILNGNDRPLAVQAAQSLPRFGPEAKQATSHLLAGLKIDHAVFRLACADALSQIDADQIPHAISPLIEVLRRGNVNEKQQVLALLARFGAQAKPAIPTLHDLLKTEPLPMRVTIAGTLNLIDRKQIGPAMPSLIEALNAKQEHHAMQRIAVRLLASVGPDAKDAVPALKELLKASLKGQGISSSTVIDCLKKVDAKADVMPAVIEALNSKNADEREDASFAVQDFLGVSALDSLEAAIANGQLRETPQVVSLLKQLRPRAAGNK